MAIDQDSQTATFVGDVPSVSEVDSDPVKVYIELTLQNGTLVKFEQTLTIEIVANASTQIITVEGESDV